MLKNVSLQLFGPYNPPSIFMSKHMWPKFNSQNIAHKHNVGMEYTLDMSFLECRNRQ